MARRKNTAFLPKKPIRDLRAIAGYNIRTIAATRHEENLIPEFNMSDLSTEELEEKEDENSEEEDEDEDSGSFLLLSNVNRWHG